MVFPFEKITHYGTPEDDFVRVTDHFHLEGDQLVIDRRILLRASINHISLDVSLGGRTMVKESS